MIPLPTRPVQSPFIRMIEDQKFEKWVVHESDRELVLYSTPLASEKFQEELRSEVSWEWKLFFLETRDIPKEPG